MLSYGNNSKCKSQLGFVLFDFLKSLKMSVEPYLFSSGFFFFFSLFEINYLFIVAVEKGIGE